MGKFDPGSTVVESNAPNSPSSAATPDSTATQTRDAAENAQTPGIRLIRQWYWRALLAAPLVPIAFFLREPLARNNPSFAPFITFYPAVLLAALLGGLWSGILVTVACTFVVQYWIFAPIGRFQVDDPYEAVSLLIFLSFGISLSIVVERYHRNREKLAAYRVNEAVSNERRKSAEERRVAESIRIERKRLLDVLETLPAMISLRSPDHRVAFANRSFREKFGEPAGRRCFETRFGRTEPCENCETFIPLQTGKPHHREIVFPDASRIEAYDFPFTDLDGTALILEMGIDVTERKRAETALQNYREHLEELIADRTRQLEAANARLEADVRAFERTDSILRESRAKLLAALSSMSDSVLITDADGNFIDFNDAFARFYRFNSKAECPKTFDEFINLFEVSIDSRAAAPRDSFAMPRALRGEKVVNAEYTLRRKDTGESWIGSISFGPIRDDGGTIIGTVITARDITEAKRSESRLRRFYETSLFAVLYWKIDGGVVDVNDEFLRLTGYTRDDVRAGLLNWSAMTPPEYWPLDEEARRQVKETGIHLPYEKEFIRKDGRRVWGAFWAAAYEDDRNEGVTFILDISRRKQAEAELAEARQQAERSASQLRTIFDSVEERLYVCDQAGNPIMANDVSRRSYGEDYAFVPPSVEQMKDSIAVYDLQGRAIPITEWPISRVLRGEHVKSTEVRVRFKAVGQEQIISCNGSAIRDKDGNIQMAVLSSADITERKRGEEAILQGEKIALQREQFQALAERMRRVREEERTRVSRDLHDQIGQILTAIKMDLTWTTRRLPPHDELIQRLKGTIRLINEGVQSVRNICSGLRPGVLDDLGLAAAIEWQANEFAARTGIACQHSIEFAELDLSGDCATEIFRIFQECLTNVIRHAHAHTVRVSLTEKEGDLHLVVADDGQGFRESDVSGSLGFLGMKERAQMCNGDIQIVGDPGKGTTVSLRVPVRRVGSNEKIHAHSDSR
jgi:PAS domain S-box-containing protein